MSKGKEAMSAHKILEDEHNGDTQCQGSWWQKKKPLHERERERGNTHLVILVIHIIFQPDFPSSVFELEGSWTPEDQWPYYYVRDILEASASRSRA